MENKRREDCITLSGIILNPRIGVGPEERLAPQKCVADLSLWGDFHDAADADDLALSVDYAQILLFAQQIAAAGEYCLVEALAYRILREVIHAFPIGRARIKLRKWPQALIGSIDFVEVEVELP
jgi:7,8-dihydroneopterin aldolase/epimerase/oxygenase